jgi:hypothetical protein
MITATRKRETKLRSVKGLSNYGVIINAKGGGKMSPSLASGHRSFRRDFKITPT